MKGSHGLLLCCVSAVFIFIIYLFILDSLLLMLILVCLSSLVTVSCFVYMED